MIPVVHFWPIPTLPPSRSILYGRNSFQVDEPIFMMQLAHQTEKLAFGLLFDM
jgi:hypothetical protein